LRTNRDTTPEGFHDKVLSDHITRNRKASQQVNDPQSLPLHEVERVGPESRLSVTDSLALSREIRRFVRFVKLPLAGWGRLVMADLRGLLAGVRTGHDGGDV
jgi:hypothetical protein